MLGNIGDLFVKCMRHVTKGHLYHLLGYRITMYCIGTGPSQLCETSAKITDWVTDPLDGSVTFCEKFVVRWREF